MLYIRVLGEETSEAKAGTRFFHVRFEVFGMASERFLTRGRDREQKLSEISSE